MNIEEFFADSAEAESNLILLENARWERKEFVERICEASETEGAKQGTSFLA
jgi:hypothetical protein